MIEARERDRYTKLKHSVMKNSMLQTSSNYLQLFSKGAHLFNGVYDVVELMPDSPPDNPSTFDTMQEMMAKSSESIQNIPDSVQCRYVTMLVVAGRSDTRGHGEAASWLVIVVRGKHALVRHYS